jgi:D-ribose pyranase
MLKTGILNPNINALLARFRHTNTIVIADRGFPYWPRVETIDLALTDDIPKVTDVLRALQRVVTYGAVYMAEEFLENNTDALAAEYRALTNEIPIKFEPHPVFKLRVPSAIGIIRTADITQYANIVLESA